MNTPTKLKIHAFEDNVIISNSNHVIAIVNQKCLNPAERDAEIVRAVNYHDRLVDMVQKLKQAHEDAVFRLDFLTNSGNKLIASHNAKKDDMVLYAQQLLTEIEKSNGK